MKAYGKHGERLQCEWWKGPHMWTIGQEASQQRDVADTIMHKLEKITLHLEIMDNVYAFLIYCYMGQYIWER